MFNLVSFATLATSISFAFAAPAYDTSLTSRAGAPFRNPISPLVNRNKCMGIVGGTYANGTQVDIFDCNGSISQLWQLFGVEGSNIAHTYHTTPLDDSEDYCLDAGNVDELANGVKVKIWKCIDGLPQQQWIAQPSGQINLSVGGFCLDLTDGDTTNSNVLQIWECTSPDENQVWVVDGQS